MHFFDLMQAKLIRLGSIVVASLLLLYVLMLGPACRMCMYGQVDYNTVFVVERAYGPLFMATRGTGLDDLLYWYRDLWVFSYSPYPDFRCGIDAASDTPDGPLPDQENKQ